MTKRTRTSSVTSSSGLAATAMTASVARLDRADGIRPAGQSRGIERRRADRRGWRHSGLHHQLEFLCVLAVDEISEVPISPNAVGRTLSLSTFPDVRGRLFTGNRLIHWMLRERPHRCHTPGASSKQRGWDRGGG
jgi:hypothetical protein